jgi:hypothetical protein
MRKFLFFLAVLTFLIPALPALAITAPAHTTTVTPSPSLLTKLSTWKEKDLRKQLGRKLTVKEKVAFFLLKKKARKMAKEEGKIGENAYVAGLLAIGLLVAGMLFPPLLIGSFIAAIVAVVSGSKALRLEPGNKKAKTGRLLGWITLFVFLLLVIAAILIISLLTSMW